MGDGIEKNEMGWACGADRGEERHIQVSGGETSGKETTWETLVYIRDNKMDLQEVGCVVLDWIKLTQDSDRWGGNFVCSN